MKKVSSIFLFVIACIFTANSQTASFSQVVQLSASVEENPAKIILHWAGFDDADNYVVYKKSRQTKIWGNAIAQPTDTFFIDNNVNIGIAYDYMVGKIEGTNITALGFTYSGIKIPAIESRGAVILLVDDHYTLPLQNEIERLEKDMINDGWFVIKHNIPRTKTVVEVKDIIVSDYNSYQNVKTVFLFGHIAVPYSGNMNYDGHSNHKGAWPADVFYGDIDGTWTDNTVNNSTASRDENKNIPGDGKYDQMTLPSEVELEIGRVDLLNMPAFALNDTALMKRYLDKDHDFRTGIIQVEQRGIIDDNFNSYNLTASGWQNFSSMFGQENVFDNKRDGKDYFTELQAKSYLWSSGSGGGSYTSCSGIGRTSDFATKDVKTVFTMLTGSYFGDWDIENNLLRAAIASEPFCLTSCWGAIPLWYFQHMILGQNIGYATRLTQNNTTEFYHGNFNWSFNKTHIALMGDPTIRMHVVKPPSGITVDSIANVTCQINWTASTDNDILGYNIYKSNLLHGTFIKVNDNLVSGTTFTDDESYNGNTVYMVRAVKLQQTASGTYFNLSQGIVDSASTNWPSSIANSTLSNENISVYPNPTTAKVNLVLNFQNSTTINICITNMLGKVIFEDKLENFNGRYHKVINLSKYPKGIYLCKVSNEISSVSKRILLK